MDKLTNIFKHTQEITMDTTCSQCITRPMPLLNTPRAASAWAATARAWWTGLTTPRQTHRTESELRALDGLTAETLKDIGAPEWVLERSLSSQERARQGGLFERDSLRWR
jgi:hypothetical protein